MPRKPGPRTRAGKLAVRHNALRHGLLAATPVIPGVESEEEWHAFRTRIVDDLAPVGAVEEQLAERAALLFWRLKRVSLVEAEVIATSRERVPMDYAKAVAFSAAPMSEERAEQALRLVSSTRALLERLPRLADHVRIEAEQAADFLDLLAGDAIEAEAVLLPGIPEGVEPAAFPGWTAALLRNAAAAVAEALGVETAQLLAAAMERAPNAEAAAAAQLDRTRAALERMRRERLLPGDTAVNAIRRYETALDRQLHRALNELEARQDRRAGHRVPLQRVQIHGLPGAS